MNLTPCAIEFLIHCYITGSPHPRIFAPVYRDIIPYFLKHNLIVPTDELNVYKTTDRGKSHVMQLCNLDFPNLMCVDANNNIIN